MGLAPTPGVGDRRARAVAAKQVLRLTLRGRTLELAPGNLPFDVKIAVRKSCGGLPFSAFWSSEAAIDEDSLMVMWWVARRVNGESNLTLQKVIEEWPTDLAAEDVDVELLSDDDEVEAPEASGPGSMTPGPAWPSISTSTPGTSND